MKVCQNQDSLTIDFFLGTDYTENTDFLYSFSVKSCNPCLKEIVKCILTPSFSYRIKLTDSCFSIFNSQIRKASRPLRLRIRIPALRTERAAEPVLPVQALPLLR